MISRTYSHTALPFELLGRLGSGQMQVPLCIPYWLSNESWWVKHDDLSFCTEDFNMCEVREIIAMKQVTYAGMKEPWNKLLNGIGPHDLYDCTAVQCLLKHSIFWPPCYQGDNLVYQMRNYNKVQIAAVWTCTTSWRFQRPIESGKASLEAKPCNSVKRAQFVPLQSVSIDDNIWHSYVKTARWQYTFYSKKTRFREPMGWGIQGI